MVIPNWQRWSAHSGPARTTRLHPPPDDQVAKAAGIPFSGGTTNQVYDGTAVEVQPGDRAPLRLADL